MSLRSFNFLRPAGAPPAGWWLLAAGFLSLAAAKWCDHQWSAEREEALQAQAQRATALQATQRPATPPASSVTERRLQSAQAELRRPWMASLRSIELAVVDPVYLLSLSFEPGAGAIRLEAEAPSFEHALAFTQVLADGANITSAMLASHEPAADPSGARPGVHFTVLARWNSP